MKTIFRISFLLLAISVISMQMLASVYESNNDPNAVKKVIMRSTIICGNYYSYSFTCEHYLGYQESMIYVDFGTGDCTYVYSAESTAWIPGGISSVSLVTGSGWEFAPSVLKNSSNMFFNFTGETLTVRAKTATGSVVDQGLQWHVTDVVNDVVTHDWVTQNTLSLGSLASGPAFLVEARFLGSNAHFAVRLDFAAGSHGLGIDGDAHKYRRANSFPYGQERASTCVLASLRNVLAIKGAEVIPTEAEIIHVMVANGMTLYDFILKGSDRGIDPDDLEAKANLILNPKGFAATRHTLSKSEMTTKLNEGSVFIIGTRVNSLVIGDFSINDNHAVVIRKNGSIYEVIDPGTEKVTKYKADKLDIVLSHLAWSNGSPPITNQAWEITPHP
jgi:hypothetical protein